MEDRAIYADRGERADQRTISVEVDAFYDGFRLRNTADYVPAVRGEQIRPVQSVHAASSPVGCGLRGSGRAHRHRSSQAHRRTA